MRTPEEAASELLLCALTHDEGSRIIGNVMACEVARLAALSIDTCPKCGATAFVDIDCQVCRIASVLLNQVQRCENKR